MPEEKWSVTYTWHDSEEKWHTASEIVDAETIGEAIRDEDEYLADKMERKGWSDYWITGANIVPEMH